MSTPGKVRQSGIPGPGHARATGIPTPGRSRSTSTVAPHPPAQDVDFMSRAFADAIKANDPAQHRPTRATVPASLSPQSAQSGRRSVAADRPSSVASTSRPKTPTTTRPPSRPPSRHSDVFGRSVSRGFEVGDNVRIESLGYEGTLRYVGEIDGKLGLWAGVELAGGFAGKGKNNGTVNGKYYFSCPENCGVFVATVKLSAPTVGHGAMQRPPSVASSRSGRVTPAFSGRMTPSASSSISGFRGPPSVSSSSGRVTPSTSGRITPSISNGRVTPGTTPAARARARGMSKSKPSENSDSSVSSLSDKISPGSRASKYVSMTAKQLSSRDAGTSSPSRRIPEKETTVPRLSSSPSRSISSPTRPPGSPFATPKPGLIGRVPNGLTPSKVRPSVITPRQRIPSAIAMPPPASPLTGPLRSVSLNDHAGVSDKQHWGSSPEPGVFTSSEDRLLVDQLQSRVDALEYENERLRSAPASIISEPVPDISLQVESLKLERDDAKNRISRLEADLLALKESFDTQNAQIITLEQARETALLELEAQKKVNEDDLKAIQLKMDESASLTKSLQKIIDDKERENSTLMKNREVEVALLESKVQKAYLELEEERRELGAQIDELREAGQETIALYEERLSTADSQRYELETRVAILDASLKPAARPSSPTSASKMSESATQIDNESLRDQVLHLQKKIATMEDMLEDSHAASEKDEAALRERMRRLKEKEEGMKKELNEGRKEVERMIKSEASARGRVEEIEEALRESTVALENARAEVEGLRVELANLDGLVASSSGDLTSKVAEVTQRASIDRARFNGEIVKLQELLEISRAKEREADERLKADSLEDDEQSITIQELQQAVVNLEVQNASLQQKNDEWEARLASLAQTLDERTNELESARKRSNRDVTINNGQQSPSPSSKSEASVAREEITGLKHIVQELQKENLASAQQNKLLQSENQLLLSETEQLRQEIQILESGLDETFMREDDATVEKSPTPGSSDMESLQKQKIRLESEVEQLRKRLADAEMKNARTAHELNKEISELEALVESKIYREDELEEELERMKEKMARHKKSSKNSTDTVTVESRHLSSGSMASNSNGEPQEVCEICERPGHDIFNCDLLKDDTGGATAAVVCEDCEEHGHVAAECPHSLDVF